LTSAPPRPRIGPILHVAAIAWEDYLPQIVKTWPDQNIVIGSDFDHGDAISTWLNTIAPIKAMTRISPADKEKISRRQRGAAVWDEGLTVRRKPPLVVRISRGLRV
jgi:hypothetical protein